ncbi:hypothetical protein [Tuberibacillus sp. Marseille-P3662]|uniref:hypothetical protein n=1 Tax=Tuberibacillus sp. Marseille-P3662 TaxID=1965358 RepID=UPI001592DDB2|nr:hypothetical protein [Tuberibacillus sp. Marseille-P3662]
MYIMATFDHSIYVELALSDLEHRQNIPKENILAVPLDKRMEQKQLIDSIHRADGVSLFDLGAALATGFGVIGASVGFQLEWGPIIWGITAAVIGFILGFLIKLIFIGTQHQYQKNPKNKTSELIVIIHCYNNQIERIEKTLWDNLALGVAILDNEWQST